MECPQKFQGWGVLKAKISEAKVLAKLRFLEWDAKQKKMMGWSTDTFWNQYKAAV